MGLELWEEIQVRYRNVGVSSIEIILQVMRLDEITKRVNLDRTEKEIPGLSPGGIQYLEVQERRTKKQKRP